MAIIMCPDGHFYDSVKFDKCPHCGNTNPRSVNRDEGIDVQVLSGESQWNRQFQSASSGEEKTIGLYKKTRGMDPVTGWLVCVEGGERGRDYRLHTGRNFVGRSYAMQICIADDHEISRENHCSVVYEPVKGIFLLAPGSGTNTYLNGERLDTAAVLKKGDQIQFGATVMEFIPYCGEGQSWD